MSSSGNIINYSLRPAKSIERKLIADSVSGIILNQGASEYTYIGFGSKYFVDFLYFHRHLHIDNMISIERDTYNQSVYEFNKPLSCIELKFGESSEILPRLDFSNPVFVWLDYDGPFKGSMLEDIDDLVSRCKSGSILLISFNSKPYNIEHLKRKYATDIIPGLIKKELISNINEAAIPSDLNERGLNRWSNFSKLLHTITNKYIKASISRKNDAEEAGNFIYDQMFYFDYKDGAEMTTIGGVIYKEESKDNVYRNGSMDMPFLRTGGESCIIEVPMLTSKESRSLLSHMPLNMDLVNEIVDEGIFKKSVIEKYNEFYKYYPNYAEIDH
ncbi:O-methyltransferase [Saccharospirillum mangrovi]|uniref:O-methyltransferase n=1 Tax=Saccharospirillum mangrovi TaxID=2161747 RepID=UPI000D38D5C9|nr:O-methyltransferase [Saccharospirillum mangrovi]